jgi:serine phosphatase RsbU (regulator of sigma subunit)
VAEPDAPRVAAWTAVGVALPIAMSLAILALDVAEGPKTQYVGLLVAAPFVAAALVGPLLTALVGAVTLGLAFGVGFLQEDETLTRAAAFTEPQEIRLGFILCASALAVVVAGLRRTRQARLARLTQISEVAQRTILPDLPPVVGEVACAARYQSATSEARVGGDLFEVLDTGFGVRALVGDARGKGLEAVRLSGYVLGSFREVAWSEPDLGKVATALDLAVRRIGAAEDFVTAALVELRGDGAARLVVCGHPAPLALPAPGAVGAPDPAPDATRAAGRHRRLPVRLRRRAAPQPLPVRRLGPCVADPPLGLLVGPPSVATAPVATGERLLLLTDGVIEARHRGAFLDVDRTVGLAFREPDLDDALDAVLQQLRRYVRGQVPDDVALVALRVPYQHSWSAPAAPVDLTTGRRQVAPR